MDTATDALPSKKG
jgi:hypothetical protein